MEHQEHHPHHSTRAMAISATLHCITGCSIGEILGLIIGTVSGLSNVANVALSITLAFVFGYSLSMLPLLKVGLPFKKVLLTILAADTLSILTMEIVDNTIMVAVPGAMNANLVNPLYWITMSVALLAAFIVVVPVNQYLLNKGKGHALVHEYHH